MGYRWAYWWVNDEPIDGLTMNLLIDIEDHLIKDSRQQTVAQVSHATYLSNKMQIWASSA